MVLPVFRKRHPPVGSRPGTLVMGADAVPPRMHAFRYDPDGVTECDIATPADARALITGTGVTWIDIQGLGDEKMLRSMAEVFEIHLLALEDVVNVPQRPKVESYGAQQLLITRMLQLGPDLMLDLEQVSLVFGPGYILSFQERYGDILDPVRRRIREGIGPIRVQGSDYLAYAILDTIVDGYYPVIEQLGEKLAEIEVRIMDRTTRRDLDLLNRVRAALAGTSRAILPQREALARLQRGESSGFSPEVLVYLRDTYDHCAQLADVVDSHRDLANGLLNTYLSLVGMRTNEVMKVLTIMASIFIPLTFLAGIYGMNFEAMPELHDPYAYPLLLLVMALLALGMLFYFRRKGWIGEDEDR
ncbi:MAG: magnesium/cobalt transporter CorA [Vicinamibacterales bacterium]